MRSQKTAILLCLPAILLVLSVAVLPILETLRLSLYEIDLKVSGPSSFVGLANYARMAGDPRALASLRFTVLFTALSVSVEFMIGLGLALMLNRIFFGTGLFRMVGLLPWAVPTVVSGLLWSFILNDQYGILNDLLVRAGWITEYRSWLGTGTLATFSLVLADVWKTTPFVAILLLSGLQTVRQELYESAAIDGAGTIAKFWHVTLPSLRPAILVTLIFRTLDAFRIFDLVYVLTGGGPGNATETLSLYSYKTLFSYLDFGYGSALAVFTALSVAAISALYVLLYRQVARS